MKELRTWGALTAGAVVIVGMLVGFRVPPAPPEQIDPTLFQETIEAGISARFTATALQQLGATQTMEAAIQQTATAASTPIPSATPSPSPTFTPTATPTATPTPLPPLGANSETLLIPGARVVFRDDFASSTLASGWEVEGSSSPVLQNGTMLFRGTGGNWQFLNRYGIREGQGVLVLFQPPAEGEVLLASGEPPTNLCRWMLISSNRTLSLNYELGDHSNRRIIGSRPLNPDRWYYVLLWIGSDGTLYARLWERGTSSYLISASRRPPSCIGRVWTLQLTVLSGLMRVEYVQWLYFDSDSLMPLRPPQAAPLLTIRSQNVALLERPALNAQVVARMPSGQVLPAVGRSQNALFFQVEYNGQLVWVRAAQVDAGDAAAILPVVDPPAPAAGSAPPTSNRTGLLGEYYNDTNFTQLVTTRIDRTVNFEWLDGSPAPGVDDETFSVRWRGQVEPRVTGVHTFTVVTDDGVRLWVNGERIIDSWRVQGETEYSGTIWLQAGRRYDLVLEYYENTGWAIIKLFWSYPGQSRQFIPTSQLHPAEPLTFGSILFASDFEDRNLSSFRVQGGWRFVTEGSDTMLCIDNTRDQHGSYPSVFFGAGYWRDYTVEARVRFRTGVGEAAILTRLGPELSIGYRHKIRLTPGGFFEQFECCTDNSRALGSGALDLRSGQWHVLRAEVQGRMVRTFVDGVQRAYDSSIFRSSGLAGIEAGPGTSVCIDNLVVRTLQALPVAEHGTAITRSNVRLGPSTSFRSFAVLSEGERVIILDRNVDGSWLYIRREADHVQGWVYAPNIQGLAGRSSQGLVGVARGEAMTRTDIRTSSDSRTSVFLATLQRGERVVILDHSANGNWLYVRKESDSLVQGWVLAQHIRMIP